MHPDGESRPGVFTKETFVETITLVRYGHIRHRFDFRLVENWKSKFFRFAPTRTQAYAPDGDLHWNKLSDDKFKQIGRMDGTGITIIITEANLEGDYYIRHVGDNIFVFSLYGVADILEHENIRLEHFVLKNIYEVFLLLLCNDCPPARDGIPSIIHDETRSCLFDMNGNKNDVVVSSENPIICGICKTSLGMKPLPARTVEDIELELRRLKKRLYYRVSDWIKSYPIWSFAIVSSIGLSLNLVASLVYDLLKSWIAFGK
jgi:hypothetical protein